MEHSPLYPPDHEQAHALGEQLTSIPTDYQKTLATFSVLDAVATGRGSTALGRFLAILGSWCEQSQVLYLRSLDAILAKCYPPLAFPVYC